MRILDARPAVLRLTNERDRVNVRWRIAAVAAETNGPSLQLHPTNRTRGRAVEVRVDDERLSERYEREAVHRFDLRRADRLIVLVVGEERDISRGARYDCEVGRAASAVADTI